MISGNIAAIESLKELAQKQGISAQRLPVSNAFHSPLVAKAAERLRELTRIPRSPARIDGSLISSCDGSHVSTDVDMREHFAAQIVKPVDFMSAVESLSKHCDVLVEVGPGGILSKLISQIRQGPRLSVWPVERDAESFDDLNWLIGLAHVYGTPIAWQEVYAQRIIKPFIPAKNLSFLVNPCERPLDVAEAHGINLAGEVLEEREDASGISEVAPPIAEAPAKNGGAASAAYQVILETATRLTGYSAAKINPKHRLADDLNLDSIKVSTLIEEACAALGVPGQLDPAAWAGATLGSIARELDAVVAAKRAPATTTRPYAEGVLLDLAAQVTGFDRAALVPTASFTEDLNLDSIKIADLISKAEAALGIGPSVDPAAAATATIGEVAAKMEALRPSGPKANGSTIQLQPSPKSAPADWVRTFEMRLVPSTLEAKQGAAPEYANRLVVIQCDQEDRELGVALGQRFTALGARILTVDDAQLLNEMRTDIDRIVVILPRSVPQGARASELLARSIARLRAAAIASARGGAADGPCVALAGGIDHGRAAGFFEVVCPYQPVVISTATAAA